MLLFLPSLTREESKSWQEPDPLKEELAVLHKRAVDQHEQMVAQHKREISEHKEELDFRERELAVDAVSSGLESVHVKSP